MNEYFCLNHRILEIVPIWLKPILMWFDVRFTPLKIDIKVVLYNSMYSKFVTNLSVLHRQTCSEVRCKIPYKAANSTVCQSRISQFFSVQHTGTCKEAGLAASPTNSKSLECRCQVVAWTPHHHGDRVWTGRQAISQPWEKKNAKKL